MKEPVINANEFIRNCNAHTADELAPYEDQFVAWSVDGKQILAYARDENELYKEVHRLGLVDYVISYIPPSGVSFLGGGFEGAL